MPRIGPRTFAFPSLLGEFLESTALIDIERLKLMMRIRFGLFQLVRVRRAGDASDGIERQSHRRT